MHGDEAAQTMTDEENRLAPFRLLHAHAEGVQVGHELLEAPDVSALSLRAPVAAVIDCVNGKAPRHEKLAPGSVAPAMLAVPMRDEQHGARVPLRTPSLPVQAKPPLSGEIPVLVDHRVRTIATARFQPA